MAKNILNHIDLWLKTILKYLDKHKFQARMLFFSIAISIILFSCIVSIYAGWAIYDSILTIIKCKKYG